MPINPSIKSSLRGLPENSQRAIIDLFNEMSQRINTLENRKPRFTNEQLVSIRDTAKRENQFFGAGSIGTWKIKNLIRVEELEIRKAVDLVIYKGGNLHIAEGSEVIIGK
jgi:hypothetical protein